MEFYRKPVYVVAGLILTAYGTVALMGPQGFISLRDKYRDIRQMERDNAELERVNQEMKNRIERVKSSRSQREVIVRDKLKYALPGETQFVLPEGARPETPSVPAFPPATETPGGR
jgi:cell division protein FtsB